MTVTVTSAGFNIDSDLFLSNDQSQKVTITHNCTTVYDQITMAVSNAARNVTLDNLDIDELPVGPFTVYLAVTNNAGVLNEETSCVVYFGDLLCDMLPLYKNTDNIDRVLAFEALKFVNDCMSCSCSVACELYNAATNTTTNATTGCGCGQS